MIDSQLIARKVNDDPPGYRVSFDGVAVGSIAQRTHHIKLEDHWHWGVDTMPLMPHGGRPPEGDAECFESALRDFKLALAHWHAGLPTGLWDKNRDYIKHCAERHLRR